MPVVLVTCVGSGVGQSVIDSLNLKREHKIIGCDGNRNVYANSFCDKLIVVPNLYSEGYVEYILKLCIDNKVDILIPGHDHELSLFSKKASLFQEKGIEVLVSEPMIIEVSRDKKEWYEYFAPLGCNIVPTFSVKEFKENPKNDIFPAIVKPSGGSASQGIVVLNDASEFSKLENEEGSIIQPYLFPVSDDENYQMILKNVTNGKFVQMSEISIQLIFTKESKFSAIFISKNSLKNGVPVFVNPINPDEFEYLDEIMKFVPILEQKGVKGPVNIQGRITDKGLVFFEMNMRFTGITGNRAQLGFNEVDFLVNNFLGKTSKLNTYSCNKLGVRQVACVTIARKENKKKPTLTVLGGGSQIGEIYVKNVLNQFDTINLIVRDESISKYQSKFDSENIKLISFNDTNLQQALSQTDVLINFISALAPSSENAKYEVVRFLFAMTTKITKALIPIIINISSQSVYSQKDNLKKTEKEPVCLDNPYSFQKVIIEDFFNSINSFSPTSKVVSLRLPRVINPKIAGQSGFFGRMIQDIKNGNTVKIDCPNNNTNLIHIEDVVSAIQFVVSEINNKEFPFAVNISGTNLSMKEYVDKIQKIIPNITGDFELGTTNEVNVSSMIDGSFINSMGWQKMKTIENIITELQ